MHINSKFNYFFLLSFTTENLNNFGNACFNNCNFDYNLKI